MPRFICCCSDSIYTTLFIPVRNNSRIEFIKGRCSFEAWFQTLEQGVAASSEVVLPPLRLLTTRDGEFKGFLMKMGLGTASDQKKLFLRALFLAPGC